MNVKELLIRQAKNYPQKKAIIFEGEAITFLKLREISFKLANYLLESGAGSHEKVAIFLPNSPEAAVSFLGTFSAGLVAVPLDFMLTEEEVINFLRHSEAEILITQPKREIDLQNIKNSCPSLKEIIICKDKGGGYPFWKLALKDIAGSEPSGEIAESSLAAIFYTSGSTGHPKGAMLTFKNLNNPSRVIDYFLKINSDDIFLCGGLPFSHIGGLDYLLLTVHFASTLILMERFQPLEFLKNIEKHKVTVFCIVPAMYLAVLSLKAYDKFDLSSLRCAVVFGAPSSPALLRRFQKAYPRAKLSNGWGMTETSAPNCMLPPGLDQIQSIGKFAPWMEVKVVSESGAAVFANQQGELFVRGEAVMRGYYKEKELTAQVLDKEGWLRTGDIAYYDSEGFFYLVGRKKEMIKVAGEIVFLAEVEEKIVRNPKVKEAAVIGVADQLRGEVPKAFIVTGEGESLKEEELKDFLKEHLAHFKMPHHFEFVQALPRNRTGKVDKRALKESKNIFFGRS